MGEKVDISSLIRAYDSFSNALQFAKEIETKYSDEIFYAKEGARASVIQHLEYTYELSWKIMKRFLRIDIGSEVDTLSRKELFRMIGEKQLIDDFESWNEFNTAKTELHIQIFMDIMKNLQKKSMKSP
ncbi:MAG: nucleotidyltransferase substrate binding protein [Methanobrevibacter sp. CfCl-M3]